MTQFSAADYRFMAEAIRLAKRGGIETRPNPRVGCVIVKEGRIIGKGFHQRAGEAHAEVNALQAATEEVAGATAYVTLEPCCHEGKTGPCSNALIKAGIKRVVIAMSDPFPAVSGKGSEQLRAAGIHVDSGLLESQASKLNTGFIKRHTSGLPFVCGKTGCSLDGRTAMQSGESQWITSSDARRDVQRLRARHDVILTGVGTVLADNPSLSIRDAADHAQPDRVILDSRLRTPADAKLLTLPGKTLIYCVDDKLRMPLDAAGALVIKVADDGNNRVSIAAVLADLAQKSINSVLVESGASLLGSFVKNQLLDELVLYQAPQLLGSMTEGLIETPDWLSLSDRCHLAVSDRRMLGDDLRITARLRYE